MQYVPPRYANTGGSTFLAYIAGLSAPPFYNGPDRRFPAFAEAWRALPVSPEPCRYFLPHKGKDPWRNPGRTAFPQEEKRLS